MSHGLVWECVRNIASCSHLNESKQMVHHIALYAVFFNGLVEGKILSGNHRFSHYIPSGKHTNN